MKTDPLGNRRLQDAILDAFGRLTDGETQSLARALPVEAEKRGFTYQREGGEIETMSLVLVPSFYTAEQVKYLQRLSLAVQRGVEAVYGAYFLDDSLERLLPLDESEKEWISKYRGARLASERLWCRLDCHFHMKDMDWKDRISVFEINSSAVGGIHYSPTADSLFQDVVLPHIKGKLPAHLAYRRNPDSREMLRLLLERHAAAVDRKGMKIVFSEDTAAAEGITEGPYIVEHWKRGGHRAELADPRELRVKNGEVYLKDDPVGVIYRNFEVKDLIEMESGGDDVEAIRLAFSRNMVVSTLSGDFDHKSLWEALTSGAYDKYFRADDARMFKKHLLWTRTVRETRTDGPLGLDIDLVPYAVKNKDSLVLKPNRLYGGYGVAIGPSTESGQWESLIGTALREGGWVFQKYGAPEEFTFPVIEGDGLGYERHNIVYGLTSTADGTMVLGRVSPRSVVNVAQHGGLMPVFISGEEGAD